MTSFTVEAAAFARTLNFVTGSIARRTTIPILEHVEIDVGNGKVVVRGTDMTMESSASCLAEVHDPGLITAPGAMLASMVSRLPNAATVTIATEDDGRASVKAGKSRYQIRTLPAEEFPSPRPMGDGAAAWSMAGSDLARLIAVTKGAVSAQDDRIYLNGVHIHHERTGNNRALMVAVATDGHRLVRLAIDAPNGTDAIPDNIIIPTESLRQIEEIAKRGDVAVSTDGHRMAFHADGASVSTALVGGTYPDYKRVIPQPNGSMFEASADEVGEAVDRAMVVFSGDGLATTIALSVSGGNLVVESAASKGDAGREEVGIVDGTEGSIIRLNGKYLREALSLWGDSVVSVQHSGYQAPILIVSDSNPQMTQVIMPVGK